MNAAASTTTGSEILDDLAEVIGVEAAFALAWEFRGLRLYVPKDPKVEPGIAAAIGEDRAGQFCRVFGGTTVTFPMREVNRRKVHHLRYVKGLTHHKIAREMRISERQVYHLLKCPPLGMNAASDSLTDDRQFSLL